VPSLVQLGGERHGHGIRAHEEQPLTWADVVAQMFERQSPASDDGDDENAGQQEDPATDDGGGKPEVNRRQGERGGGERLDQPYEQLSAVGHEPHVVQIGVVQTALRHDRNQEHAPHAPICTEDVRLPLAEAQVHRHHDGNGDQQAFDSDERRCPQRGAHAYLVAVAAGGCCE
jgi:hypothetical protein